MAENKTTLLYKEGETETAKLVNNTYAVQFKVDRPFKELLIHVELADKADKKGYFTAELYRFVKNYSETLKNAPLHTADITGVSTGEDASFAFDETEAGEYLLYLHNAGGNLYIGLSEGNGERVGASALRKGRPHLGRRGGLARRAYGKPF